MRRRGFVRDENPDKEPCIYYQRTGVCRFGNGCLLPHIKPRSSQIVLLRGLYEAPVLSKDSDGSEVAADATEEKVQKHFDEFYEDVYFDCENKYGEIEDMMVCDNVQCHIQGNVLIKFHREEDADKAVASLNRRHFRGKQIFAELCPAKNLFEGRCKSNAARNCHITKECSFMHVKKVSNNLENTLRRHKENRMKARRVEDKWSLPGEKRESGFDSQKTHPGQKQEHRYRDRSLSPPQRKRSRFDQDKRRYPHVGNPREESWGRDKWNDDTRDRVLQRTVVLLNLYNPPQSDGPRSRGFRSALSDEELLKHFEGFFVEVFLECENKYGAIQEMNVCDNTRDDLFGHVIITFHTPEDAERAVFDLNKRTFRGRQVVAELSPDVNMEEGACPQYEMGSCSRGGLCPMMHLKPISRQLGQYLSSRSRFSRNNEGPQAQESFKLNANGAMSNQRGVFNNMSPNARRNIPWNINESNRPDMQKGPDFQGPNFPGPDFQGPNLQGSEFHGPGPDFPGPGPEYQGPGPDFPGPGSEFQGPGPDFPGPGPNFQGPNHQGSDFQGPNFQGPDFQGPNFPGPNFQGPNFHGSGLQEVDFQGLRDDNRNSNHQTVMVYHLYEPPRNLPLGNKSDVDVRAELQEYFDNFYEEVMIECEEKYGLIDEMNVCVNEKENMFGNVIIKFLRKEDAQKAVDDLNNRTFSGVRLRAEIGPNIDFQGNGCSRYQMANGVCPQGAQCPFLHIMRPSRAMEQYLFIERRRGGKGEEIPGNHGQGNSPAAFGPETLVSYPPIKRIFGSGQPGYSNPAAKGIPFGAGNQPMNRGSEQMIDNGGMSMNFKTTSLSPDLPPELSMRCKEAEQHFHQRAFFQKIEPTLKNVKRYEEAKCRYLETLRESEEYLKSIRI